jgi:hypothetical protein
MSGAPQSSRDRGLREGCPCIIQATAAAAAAAVQQLLETQPAKELLIARTDSTHVHAQPAVAALNSPRVAIRVDAVICYLQHPSGIQSAK